MQGIARLVIPKSKDELSAFVCMMAWWSCTIPGLSGRLAPLTNQTKEGVRFDMNLECQIAYSDCMFLLTNGISLYAPEPEEELHGYPDASEVALEETLMIQRAPKEVLRLGGEIRGWADEMERQRLHRKGVNPWRMIGRSNIRMMHRFGTGGPPRRDGCPINRASRAMEQIREKSCLFKLPTSMKNYELAATEFLISKTIFMNMRSVYVFVIHSDHKALTSLLKGEPVSPDTLSIKKIAWIQSGNGWTRTMARSGVRLVCDQGEHTFAHCASDEEGGGTWAETVAIVPVWSGATWFSTYCAILSEAPIVVPPEADTFFGEHGQPLEPPSWGCCLIGRIQSACVKPLQYPPQSFGNTLGFQRRPFGMRNLYGPTIPCMTVLTRVEQSNSNKERRKPVMAMHCVLSSVGKRLNEKMSMNNVCVLYREPVFAKIMTLQEPEDQIDEQLDAVSTQDTDMHTAAGKDFQVGVVMPSPVVNLVDEFEITDHDRVLNDVLMVTCDTSSPLKDLLVGQGPVVSDAPCAPFSLVGFQSSGTPWLARGQLLCMNRL
ncbi:hypothetical protein SARC_06453 [Sphaeroforma arctica JP610]|uniref:Reverse transcriptase RNase H-like domain-containing protein n=1 Tax=Sphaeroforma arctica JP610 TaxID=667725 RepID=A0A0L0FXC8_9EUKA|nr:hypothetical protein SARC_06453 [Sphaeroforma arctica JP610]KNC81206.1 hypothetical protein SARC_06453 [Sphaeroforma arctica JP610]|eukprot:XP_014155108.1 hypothetical protein SARC_06453 [Sphaeroforma arctica JP610]